MISRRRILSRSRDELNSDYMLEDEEDVWYQKEKLYKDHIQEVLNKWEQIDDEIWAKIICLERNRRVAKAYARAPVLTVNGSDDGFDGYRIGLCGFDNPMRDPKTEEVKRHIGHGVKIKMDEAGNIMVKRAAKSNVYIKEMSDEGPSSAPGKLLEPDKPVRLFDIKRFQSNVSRELRRAYPDRRKLESQCLSVVAFVKDAPEVLDCPCWVMIVNIVALDMLKSKLPIAVSKRQQSAPNLASIFEQRPRLPLPQDEDPYSLPNSSSTTNTTSSSSRGGYGTTTSNNTNNKPPQLPPRDLPQQHPAVPKPDYEDNRNGNVKFPVVQSSRKKLQPRPDDPYYCGLSARVPNFAKKPSSSSAVLEQQHAALRKSHSAGYLSFLRGQEMNHRSPYSETGTYSAQYSDYRSSEDDYGRIYGRVPLRPMPASPFGQYQQYRPREVFVGEWE